MTSKQDRLKQVYDHLREFFGIHTQIDFANAIRITRPALSSAMNGNEAYLTKNLFQKICAAFPGVFNIDYLLNGHGDLLTHEEDAKTETIRMEDKMRSPLVDIDGIVNKAVEIAVSAKDETINVLKSQVTDLRIQLVEKDKTKRPRMVFLSTSGCSKISFSMKWANPPLAMDSASKSMSWMSRVTSWLFMFTME